MTSEIIGVAASTPSMSSDDVSRRLSGAITLLPLSMRKWNDRMDLKGAVQKIDIQWEVGQNPSVEVALNDVELTVPPQLGLGDFWSRYRDQGYTPSPDPPRMFVSDGRIILQGDLLSFRDLHGRFTSDTDELLAEIPFTFDMTIRDLPSASMQDGERWVEELGRLPFTLNLRTDAFTLGTAEGDWVSMAIPSDGSYGVPEGLMSSFPVTCSNGEYSIVQGLEIDAFSQSRIDATVAELGEERDTVAGLGLI